MKMLLTRLDEGSQMAVTGDLNQADRMSDNGLLDFLNQLKSKNTNRIDVIRFEKKDVERHPAVKEILEIYGDE